MKKFCKDCKWFIEDKDHNKFHKCGFYKLKLSLVTGKKEKVFQDIKYCDILRGECEMRIPFLYDLLDIVSDTCGRRGRYFERKNESKKVY